MKVLGINSSPRGAKSQTLKLVKGVLEGAKAAGAQVELVDLCKLKIEFCTACDVCHRTGKCVHKDDFAALREKLMAADGLVFASPNYFRTVTAQMKAMIDRLADAIHCQLFAGKYAASASTSGGPACDEVTTYLNETLLSLGADVVGSVAAAAGKRPEAVAAAEAKAVELGRELAGAIAAKRVYPAQAERHLHMAAYFRRLVDLNKDRWPHEHTVWQQKGG